ncbi:imelysin family protein [Chthonobacter rhizosphaerae]|uniref:imelysin family protein n=1 Tax=Chthonobacter rhizosphaerae TaxID=2735553 RepID=UPI0015EECD7C|nr:imelysin family protein [Chthonobacter rhizosphaerae]
MHPPSRVTLALFAILAGLVVPLGTATADDDPTSSHTTPQEEAYSRLVADIIADHIRPATARFRDASDALETAVSAACATPSAAGLEDARAAFAGAVQALAALEPLRYGPLVEGNRLEKLAFWPDPRGLGLKQVQAVLAAEDPSAADPATLPAKSVAVQGLTALEFVLFGTGSDILTTSGDTKSAFRCRYGVAIAANVSRLATEVAAGWQPGGSGDVFVTAGPDNPIFLTHQEAAGEMISSMATALEIIAEQKVKSILGESPQRAKPKLSAFWRSGQTFTTMAATLQSISDELAASSAADLLSADDRWLVGAVDLELRQARAAALSIPADAETAFKDQTLRDKLGYIRIAASSLKTSIGQSYATALGLQQGFNSLDGD